jgi:hypothetical protein
VVLILGILTLVKAFMGMTSKKPFANGDKRTALFLMISCDVQLLLGLLLYFTGAWGIKNIQNMGMSAVMKEAGSRFFAVEHTIGMVAALVFVHIGYAAVKKNIADNSKFKRLFWFTFIALLLMVLHIPWSFRAAGIARPLFPGM